MDNLGILQLAELSGATHKLNLGVYQFTKDELLLFVQRVLDGVKLEQLEHSEYYFNYDRNR